MKRSRSASPEYSGHDNAKKPKTEPQERSHLLELSDDVLLNIFQHISSLDLFNLHLSCARFKQLCCDRTLWSKLDLREHYLSVEQLQEYFKFFQRSTQLVAVQGEKNANECLELSINFLETLTKKCIELKQLFVENFRIFKEKIKITDFPSTLEVLSLQGTQVLPLQTNKSYLNELGSHIPNLTSLILSRCNWMYPYSLMAISKALNLKELRLNSCHGLGECMAYISLATRYGFKNLEIADFRDTFLGDSELCALSSVDSLTELHLDCPNTEMVRQPEEEPQQQHIIHIRLIPGGQPELIEAPADAFPAENFLVTDRTVCSLGSFGGNQIIIHQMDGGFQLIRHGQIENRFQLIRPDLHLKSNNPNLKKLVIRNYRGITNQSLVHLATNVSKLEYLDVTGTSVTREGIETFRTQKPDVTLISTFDKAL